MLTYFSIILLFLAVKFETRTQNRTEHENFEFYRTEQNKKIEKNFDRTQNRTELEKISVLSSLGGNKHV